MSYQLALCNRILRTGALSDALAWGITADDFSVQEAKNLWGLLFSYYSQPNTHGSVLSPAVVQAMFPLWHPSDDMPHINLESLCHEVRKERVRIEANAATVACSEAMNIPVQDPAPVLTQLHAKLTQLIALGTAKNTDVTAKQGLAGVRRKLEQMDAGIDFSVMQWPWAPLNRATFGVQPDDYVVLYGRPKSMKTWVLCKLISWAFENQVKSLAYTKEMTPDNFYNRSYACLLRLAYDELRGGGLSMADRDRLDRLAWQMDNDQRLAETLTVLSGQDAPAGGDTVPWLQGKIKTYKPQIMFIDGMYLLSYHQKWKSDEERVRGISRALRQMVLDTGVPVIATMQATRRASQHSQANLDEIAYSDALSQDCTIAARVINDKGPSTISIVIGGSREFSLHGFRIHGVPARDFSFHSELHEADIMKAKEEDQSEAEEKVTKTRKRAAKKHQDIDPAIQAAHEDLHMNGIHNPNPLPYRMFG